MFRGTYEKRQTGFLRLARMLLCQLGNASLVCGLMGLLAALHCSQERK